LFKRKSTHKQTLQISHSMANARLSTAKIPLENTPADDPEFYTQFTPPTLPNSGYSACCLNSEILDTSTTANPPASLNNPHQFPCRLNNPRPWAFPALEGRNTPILDSSYHLSSWPRTASTTGGDATAAAFLALDANFFLARGCLGEEAPEQAREDARLYLATPRQGPLRHLLLALHHHRCLLRKALKCC
jgi:hypothetical protein